MKPTLLKKALRANAMFSTLCAIDLLFFSQSIAELMGVFDPGYIIFIGVGLLGFAAVVLFVSERSSIDIRMANIITLMDIGWVLGSALVIPFGSHWFNSIGSVLIAIVAVMTALCAYFQAKGIQQLTQESPWFGQLEVGR